jgi:tripartite-type tricarboxylate transporter receptor subunit TctC
MVRHGATWPGVHVNGQLAMQVVTVAVLSVAMMSAIGQHYPSKPVRIVTSGVGGGIDFASRLLAQGLTNNLGQRVIVDNRASGVIPGKIVATAPADGYTLLAYGSTFWITPLLQDDVPYDTVRDFSPVSILATSPNVIVVHPSVAAGSVKELISLAKARPGELNYASSGTGASNHLAAELFKSMARVNIVRVPYKSGAALMADLLGGQVQVTFSAIGAVANHLKSGKLRALAVTSARPSTLVPGLATVAEAGVPGYVTGAMYVLFAPARTPEAIIEKINEETVHVLKQPDVRERYLAAGVEAVGSTPNELAATMRNEIVRLRKVIKDAGIRNDL